MAFCLIPSLAEKFKVGLIDGTIDPAKLNDMTSEERHAFFSKMLGEDNATKVNALFESKLLLKNQQAGMISWAKKVTGITEATRMDIVSRIERMDKVLNPAAQGSFLSDLAAQRLGTRVTFAEAQKITDLSKQASDARTTLEQNPLDKTAQIAYGNKYLDMTEYVDSLKPKANPFTFSNIVNLPKSALTSIFHFSASFVQGWGMLTTKPFWQAFAHQFKYFADPQAYRDLQASIIAHPDYALAKEGKLGITHLGDKLSSREEAMQSSLLEHIPGLNKLVGASSRAFTGFLNETRFSRFTELLDAARLRGEDVNKGSKVISDLANVVNNFTGRGSLGAHDRYASIQPILNDAFFSPRKIIATIQMFNPLTYLDPRTSPTARMGALRQLGGSLIATVAVLKLAQMAGATVETNPTSTNFLKAKIGNTTFDMTGGNAIYARLLARLITGQSTSGSGKVTTLGQGYKPETRADVILNFIRGKLSPTASAIADALYGKDVVNQPFSVTSEVYNKLVPIIIQDFINLARNDPQNTAAWLPSLSAIFGVSMESPTPSGPKAVKTSGKKSFF